MPKIIIPEDLKCPLSRQLIEFPAKAADSKVYEWSAIEEWLQTSDVSPATGLKLTSKELTADEDFSNRKEAFLKTNQVCSQEKFCKTIVLVTLGERSLEDLKKLNYLDYFNDCSEQFAVAEYEISPLHYAAHENHIEMMDFLLNNGADINLEDKEGYTPLQWAYDNQSIEAILLLLARGAKFREEDGWTLLHCAAAEGSRYQETIRRLILAGVDSTGITDDGKTVEQVAEENGYEELATFIPQYRQERLNYGCLPTVKSRTDYIIFL